MHNIEQSDAWYLIKNKLESSLEHHLTKLTQLGATRDEDLVCKARIAVIKELLSLPQTLKLAANTERNQ